MSQQHGPILTLLDMIEKTKGTVGQVPLCCLHWFPAELSKRGLVTSRGITFAGDLTVEDHPASNLESGETPLGDFLSESRDGDLSVGAHVRFEGYSPVMGYVHLFNLGTSGQCVKLAPSEMCPKNWLEAGEIFELPSEQFVRMEDFPEGVWVEEGPATAATGQPERMLIIVTRYDIELECEDLHPDLQQRQLYASRGASTSGFGGPVRRNRAKLFELEPDQWEYGVLSLNVV